jgi:hypothetical protein
MITHLLQNLGVPTAVAVAVGIAAMLIRVVMAGKGRSARGGRGRWSARDDH